MQLNKYLAKHPAASILCAMIFGVAGGSPASAQSSFGVHFLGSTSDPVTGSAGVIPISGWNNIANETFTPGGSATIFSSDGLTSATLAIAGSGVNNGWNSGITGDGANLSLMHGYMDLGGSANAASTISGLTSGGLYDVFIYCMGDAPRPGNGGDLLPNYSVNGTSYYIPTLGGQYASSYDSSSTPTATGFGGFVRGATYGANFNTPVSSVSDFGNYIEVDNVIAAGGVITIDGGADTSTWRSPLNGFEIVAVPEPSAFVLSAAGLAMLGLVRSRTSSVKNRQTRG
jgi:hypothetical protein